MNKKTDRPKTKKDKKNIEDGFAINPASVAADVGGRPLSVADDELRDANGNRKAVGHTRDEVRANRLGAAAGSAVYDQRTRTELARARARAARRRAEYDASAERRSIELETHTVLTRAWRSTYEIPCGILARKRKLMSLGAKPANAVGDAAVAAVVIERSGASVWLAVLLGISMALSIVMVGSQYGSQLMLLTQRRVRRQAPKNCPSADLDLYDNGAAEEDLHRWLVLGLSTAGALLLAFTLIGVGLGDSPPLAIGFGILAALTFGGAAGAEAYGTNAVAERRDELGKKIEQSTNTLADFDRVCARAARDAELANSLALALEHAAFSAAVTTEVIADRTTDNAPVFSHTHPAPPTAFEASTPRTFDPLTVREVKISRPVVKNSSNGAGGGSNLHGNGKRVAS